MEGIQGWIGLLVYLCRDVASTLLVISCLGAVILKILEPLLSHLESLWDLLQEFQEPQPYDETNLPSLEDVLTELYYPFEDIAPYMTAQICDIINRRFKGDGSKFMLDFLLPCRELLLQLKEETWVWYEMKQGELIYL